MSFLSRTDAFTEKPGKAQSYMWSLPPSIYDKNVEDHLKKSEKAKQGRKPGHNEGCETMKPDFTHSFIHHLPMGYARHRVIYDHAGQVADYLFLEVNPAYEVMTGLQAEQVVGKKESEIFPAGTSRDFNWVAELGEVALTGISKEFIEYSAALERWLKMTVYAPCKGEFITLFQDISEEKQMEKDLKESLQFNRQIIEYANNGIIVYDSELRYRVFNPYMVQQTGVSASEVIGKHPWQVFPESLDNGVMDYLNRGLEGERTADIELGFFNPQSGKTVWSTQTFSPMKNVDEDITGVIVTIQDTTAKKEAMEEYKKLNEFIQITLENLPIGVAINEVDSSRALYMNRQFANIYGWPREDLTDIRQFFEKVYPNPAYREEMYRRTMEDIGSGNLERMRWENVTVTTQAGEERIVSAVNIPFPEQNIMVSTVWDVTKQATHEKELELAKKKAEAANHAKSQFLANMSHEIRTPMNGFMGMLQLLETTQLDEEQQELLDLTQKASEALLAVLNDILDFSRIEANKIHLTHKPFQIRKMVGDAVGLYRGLAADKGILLRYHVSENLPETVVGDSFRLRQVLANLIGNAVKFTHEGSVTIQVKGEDIAEENSLLLVVMVKDTGIGIPEQQLDLIFERFVQSEHSDNRLYGGTGLGLAISRGLAELMGGEIQAESKPGKGSCFTFTCRLDTII